MTKFAPITALLLLFVAGAHGAEYPLVGGGSISGEPASFNEQGVVIRTLDGKFSERIQWFKFTPETLKAWLNEPKAKRFVEPLVGPPPEARAAAKKAAYQIRQPPKPELPPPGTGLASAVVTPIGLALLAILMLANLFAAYEVAVFRNYPPQLVCGAAAVLPVLGPIVFLCLKSRPIQIAAPVEEALPTPEEAAPPEPAMPRPGIPDEGEPESAALKFASREEAPEETPLDFRQVFKRGEALFNRRFFETNMPGFFRVVPTGRERDLALVIRSVRGEYIGRRISRISMSDLHIQVQAGGASSEAMIPFEEIREVILRHKDAQE